MKQWTFIKHLVCTLIVISIVFISRYIAILFKLFRTSIFTPHSAASVAIIRGADGPTAGYGVSSWNFLLGYGEFIITFIILLLLYWPFKSYLKRLNKEKDANSQ